MYVEATSLTASGGDVLLAGTPNYLWNRNADGKVRLQARDSLFGAVLLPDGTARSVRAPVEARRVIGVRALGRGDGTWDVVFAETVPFTGFPPPDTAERLWYGVYDGRDWRALEQLPIPPGVRLQPFLGSSLVRRGDTLAWALKGAVPTYPSGSLVYRSDVFVFERIDGRWSADTALTRQAGYVALSASDRFGLLLGVVQPDPSLRRDQNSLLLYARTPRWQILRRVAHGGDQPVHEPAMSTAPDGREILSWWSEVQDSGGVRQEARALISPQDSTGTVLALDGSVAHFAFVATPDSLPLWVMDHVSPTTSQRELRVSRHSDRGAELLWRGQNPFQGSPATVAPGPSELLLAGALLDWTDSIVVTLLVRVRAECRASR